jgi:putative restriction endonuclease
MVKAVLTTKMDPTYDDLPEERYHFPRTYLRQVEGAVGDWIVYYEPRRATGNLLSSGGRQAYFATARLVRLTSDMAVEGHFYAWLDNYLEFDHPVAFKDGTFYYENALRKNDGSTNKGAFGRAVRKLSDEEYDLIIHAGFSHILGERERSRPFPDVPEEPMRWAQGFAEEHADYEPETALHPLVQQILQRPFRDRAFSSAVKAAYGDTCAVTGLKIINGGGRSEVQAAHIRPVADAGPDSVRNGIALSGTVHWMFDRGLISVDDDYRLLIARDRVPDTVSRIIQPSQNIILPARPEERPHLQFLKYHRENVFKG